MSDPVNVKTQIKTLSAPNYMFPVGVRGCGAQTGNPSAKSGTAAELLPLRVRLGRGGRFSMKANLGVTLERYLHTDVIDLHQLADVIALVHCIAYPPSPDQVRGVFISHSLYQQAPRHDLYLRIIDTGELPEPRNLAQLNLAMLCLAEPHSLMLLDGLGLISTFSDVIRPTEYIINDTAGIMPALMLEGIGILGLTNGLIDAARVLLDRLIGCMAKGIVELQGNDLGIYYLLGLSLAKLFACAIVSPTGAVGYENFFDLGRTTLDSTELAFIVGAIHRRYDAMSAPHRKIDVHTCIGSLIESCMSFALNQGINFSEGHGENTGSAMPAKILFECSKSYQRKWKGEPLIAGVTLPFKYPDNIDKMEVDIYDSLRIIVKITGSFADKLLATNFLLALMSIECEVLLGGYIRISPRYSVRALTVLSCADYPLNFDERLINPFYAHGYIRSLLAGPLVMTFSLSNFYKRLSLVRTREVDGDRTSGEERTIFEKLLFQFRQKVGRQNMLIGDVTEPNRPYSFGKDNATR